MDASHIIKILTVFFDAELSPNEVAYLRGAALDAMKRSNGNVDVLFHNHSEEDSFRFSYPLVQYKCIDGRAAIVCVGEGADMIGELLSSLVGEISLGGRIVELGAPQVFPIQSSIEIINGEEETYHIARWTPLNSKNYDQYRMLEGLSERISFLEKTLVGNILSMAKGLGIHFDDQIGCKILRISDPYLVRNKGVKMMAFDAFFKTNVSLPDYIGLGKHVSIGNGTVHHLPSD